LSKQSLNRNSKYWLNLHHYETSKKFLSPFKEHCFVITEQVCHRNKINKQKILI